MYIRKCPTCPRETKFKSKKAYNRAIESNRSCKQCSIRNNLSGYRNDVSNGLKPNGFLNKTDTEEFKNRLRIERIGKKVHNSKSKSKISKALSGENNPMFGKSFYDIWVEKYGKEVADKKLKKFKFKISKATEGKNNPMFGKPSPQGSGNGWKGWYKGTFFRSLHELSFLINYIERFKMPFESGEQAKWAIEYRKPTGEIGTYFSDYVINGKYMVEIKPEKLKSSPTNKAKRKAAEKFCKAKGLKYKMISPILLTETNILFLHKKNIIKFTDIYEKRFRKQYTFS